MSEGPSRPVLLLRGVGREMRKPEQLVQLWDLSERETGLTLEAALG